jgi:hypothetical protein
MYPVDHFWSYFASYFSFTLVWDSFILGFSYITVYLFVPKYLYKKKYVSFCLAVVGTYIIMYFINALQSYYQLNKTFNLMAGVQAHSFFQASNLVRILGNPPLVCGLLLSLKSLKNWYLRKTESEALTVANTNAELQLLKSQIHPHFLFNTLNNIYSYSLTNKPEAPGLVKKLKQTVQYMVSECNHPYVPLKNELKMIANYIELEKIRYGNRLSMQVELMNTDGNQLIAPLLLIPFVENSFKHGVSQMLDRPRISLKIYVEQNVLHFYLNNSKPPDTESQVHRKGIGLENVRKRLELLYPGKHKLLILTEGDTFTVQMEILLTEYIMLEKESDAFSTTENNQNFSYAT